MALTDRELLQALLDGKKLEKIRQEGSGRFIYLKDDCLVDEEGILANIYRLNDMDRHQIVEEKN